MVPMHGSVNVLLNRQSRCRFTVVIPVSRNRRAGLLSSIKSVLWQTFQDYECFILDDSSGLDFTGMISQFSDREKLRFLRFSMSHGHAYCFNYAVIRASGEFMVFLEPADIWLPSRLEDMDRSIKKKTGAGVWISNAFIRKGDSMEGLCFDPFHPPKGGKKPGWHAADFAELPWVVSATAVRRELFNDYGLMKVRTRHLAVMESMAGILAGGTEVGIISRPLAVCAEPPRVFPDDPEGGFRELMTVLDFSGTPERLLSKKKAEAARETAAFLAMRGRIRAARKIFCEGAGAGGAVSVFSFFAAVLLQFFSSGASKLSVVPVRAEQELSQVETLVRSIS
ncbi:MAG: glycosyltransferase family A protein [bacterium]